LDRATSYPTCSSGPLSPNPFKKVIDESGIPAILPAMSIRTVLLIFTVGVIFSVSRCEAQLVGFDAGGGVFAEIDNIDPDTGIPSPPPEYAGCFTDPTNVWFGGGDGGTGFTVGFAYVGDTLYGLEFDAGGYYLFTVGADPFGCAHATRVGGELGVPGYEFNSLAYCAQADVLYTHGFVTGGHLGRLYTVDRTTGAATPIGDISGEDIRIVGMTCAPFVDTLYGITSGHANRFPNVEVVIVDREDSSIDLLGVTGIPAAGSEANAESLALIEFELGDAIDLRLFAGGAQLWSIDLGTGAGTPLGSADLFNGQLFALAHRSTGGPGAGPSATPTQPAVATATPTATETAHPTATLTPTLTITFTPTPTRTPQEEPTPTFTEVPLVPDELLDLLFGYSTGAFDTAETLWRRSLDWYRQD